MAKPTDAAWMARALQLARRGLYTTHPNPRVGCVLVSHRRLVGEGWHLRAGEPHAEVHALRMAGEAAHRATAYVTLEPCSHHGRTGPCAVALIEAGVERVVVAMQDPNPEVAGRGIAMLREAGIEVEVGLLEEEARKLNVGFVSRMTRRRPFVRLKMAMSLDGRTAMQSGESQWITGPQARGEVQRLRAAASAIMTGVDSIIFDNSRLTVRASQLGLDDADAIAARQPLRVVVDTQLRLPQAAACLREPGRTLVATVPGHEPQRRARLEAAGAEVVVLRAGKDGRVDLAVLMHYLAEQELVNELLLETGATLAGAMLDAGLVDEMQLFVAPTLLGGEARPLFALPGLTRMAQQRPLEILDIRAVGRDWRITARPEHRQD
ncbi:bifunctional diaminohydroxyphosphoribosylaminopyrimidine deaminase/5-amino-6-(5-phosphoribosylamino)uracil reductase RibD [Halomonas sp. MCCC 1A17488]|uniref:bifunctional diaminohydroxyphosphoribosylaminopyrimidine deaminase/5-amino-6-(5-phosphoribosylamino)uracil reductase RibD n=1 Tax=unclassified Halomonas TaxID=2609666 RepID=UPI0018D23C17|nr:MULTISPECIES: bifunctional diaminohydroxyphosphoribosylaminopyrimidine deaminase/5-amino-6-(5-phosphoribosylamino)uracil reductase RibD [unclassified Halomonas]MCE8018125.1 bifunctional diaminohydroxyphosphoribosylaminopyrimidine deaminase/5-amino-6-(5-phosphoribosylamino)uracil reductase RibD [Halomonas sp. MCCC 1A17488]MCG3241458.1 bifunctional diaminohydroxyphosphoribosylaminopyrimidine deaminase/5-amino-6-(5-phosphoribosylamino)uracil reductase RibD [Halomonas sp. MCCC 1A17488]QPP48583.1 